MRASGGGGSPMTPQSALIGPFPFTQQRIHPVGHISDGVCICRLVLVEFGQVKKVVVPHDPIIRFHLSHLKACFTFFRIGSRLCHIALVCHVFSLPQNCNSAQTHEILEGRR